MRLLLAAVVWIAAAAGAVGISTVVADSIHTTPADASGSTPGTGSVIPNTPSGSRSGSNSGSGSGSSSGGGTPIDPSKVKASNRVSLFQPANLARALAVAGVHDITNTGGFPGSDQLFSLAGLGAGVPAALAHRIATAGHVPESKLNYVVVEGDPSHPHRVMWLVYPVQGTQAEYFEAPSATGPLFELRSNSQTGLERIQG